MSVNADVYCVEQFNSVNLIRSYVMHGTDST